MELRNERERLHQCVPNPDLPLVYVRPTLSAEFCHWWRYYAALCCYSIAFHMAVWAHLFRTDILALASHVQRFAHQ